VLKAEVKTQLSFIIGIDGTLSFLKNFFFEKD
jgi:hypothetical protein